MNRISTMIAKVEQTIAHLEPEKAVELSRKLDIDFSEYCRFQDLKSLAQLDGRLSLAESMTVFVILGNSPDHFNAESLVNKIVVTQILAAIMGVK